MPKYLSSEPSTCRRLIQAEEENVEKAILESIESHKEYLATKKISTLADILTFYNKNKPQNKLSQEWILLNENKRVFLYFLKIFGEVHQIMGSIVISEDMDYFLEINKE